MRELEETPSERPQQRTDVPEVVVTRLPQYVRVLNTLLSDGVQVANSQMLGEKLQVTPAQIRKDLSYFGRFGKQGRGYSVRHLLDELKQILGLNSQWNVVVIGVPLSVLKLRDVSSQATKESKRSC